jgi:hypothetical protein
MAVALLARRQENLSSVASNLAKTSPGSIIETLKAPFNPSDLTALSKI